MTPGEPVTAPEARPSPDGRERPEVVVITGASAGVGRAVAHAFARRGAVIGLMARGERGLEACAEEVRKLGGSALPHVVDVSDAGAVDAAAELFEARLGAIDIWVNNAMSTVFAEFADIEPEEFRRATEVTYLGTVWGTRAALRRMVRRDHGTIVQVGSALSYRAIPLQAPYCGSKFAIRGMTNSVRTELLHHGSRVRMVMVQLPAVNTPQFAWARSKMPRQPQPVPPIYQPEVVAEAIWRAAHGAQRERWVAPSAITAIVGNRIAAPLLDRYLACTGFDAQQTERTLTGPRAGNLFRPVEGAAAVHGPFDGRAREASALEWMKERRALVLGLGTAATALLALTAQRRSHRNPAMR